MFLKAELLVVYTTAVLLGWSATTFSKVAASDSLGIAIDSTIFRPTSILPSDLKPKRVFLAIFNESGEITALASENWEQVKQVLDATARESRNSEHPHNAGGAAMYAMLQLTLLLPPNSPLLLITTRMPPSDEDLRDTVAAALRSKNIQTKIIWVEQASRRQDNAKGLDYYKEFAKSIAGSVEVVSFNRYTRNHDINKLSQVTLLLREAISGELQTRIPIDSSLTEIKTNLHGTVHWATLTSPDGTNYNLLEPKNINSKGEIRRIIRLDPEMRGSWLLHAAGHNYGIRIEGTSHVAVWTSQKNHSAGDAVELWVDGSNIRKVDNIALLDANGRELEQLGHKEQRFDDNLLSSTIHIQERRQADDNQHFLQIRATDINGDYVTRLARLPENRLPTSIEVGLGSMLTASPGQRAKIYFEVSNNQPIPRSYEFLVSDNYRLIRLVNPRRSIIAGKTTEQVEIELIAPFSQQALASQPDVVTLTAQLQNGEYVIKKAYFKVGQSNYDSTSPSIYYSYNGDCSNTLNPDNCYIGTWGANVSIVDSTSGLLKITTKPVALLLNSEFIAGTTDYVYGQFSTSCCNTKVEVTAVDVLGNTYTRVIDIERKWLSAGEISAIVLGVILFILLIILIIACIVRCCRRRKRTLSIYPDH